MINPVTGWFEIAQYEDKRSISIENLVETMWMSRYPRPIETTYDQGNGFIGHDIIKPLIEMEYTITSKPSTSGNPMSNAVLEKIHQVIKNLVQILTYLLRPMSTKIIRGQVFWMQKSLQLPQQPIRKKIIVRDNLDLSVI